MDLVRARFGRSARAAVIDRHAALSRDGCGRRGRRCAGRTGGGRRIFLERHVVVGPRRQNLLDDPPQFLGLVAADGQGRVAFQDLFQQQAVGR